MSYLPYDQEGKRLLAAWNEAMSWERQWRACSSSLLPTSPPTLLALVARRLAEAVATAAAAKVAHDRYRYQQANPTHPVCASARQSLAQAVRATGPLPEHELSWERQRKNLAYLAA